MNVLYVHNVGKMGGAERVTLDIIRSLDKGAHDAFLVTPEDGPLIAAARELGATASVLKIQQPDIRKPFATLAGFRLWIDYLKKNQIDLIHIGDLFVSRTLIKPANKLGIPLVFHIHFPIDSPALRWIFRTQPKDCHFVYCSQELHDVVAPRVEAVFNGEEHQVIHNGVDTEQFRPFEIQKNMLPDDKINIGIVANLQERKGHIDLIDAVSLIYPKHQNIRVHVIGGDLFGESREMLLKQYVEDKGLSNVFIFHGQVDNIRDYLNELNILVCASHEEAFPISILEAMAFALPIVSTDVNGIPEALTHEMTSLLQPPNCPEKLAKNLVRIIEDESLGRRIGSLARKDVLEKFSLSIFGVKIASLYQKAKSKNDY
jgi:glycosyltransferase involved in cell wall biosynthesis